MKDMAEQVAQAIEKMMFAPHELPLDAELHEHYRQTAIAAINAMDQWRFEAAGISVPQQHRQGDQS
jgi:hypothetical protein